MTTSEAIQIIINNEDEEYAISILITNFAQRFADLQVKCAKRGAMLKGIKKINDQNNNAKERRNGIRALCEE